MSEIPDPTLAAIAGGYSTGGLSKATAAALYRVVRLLLASRSLNDVSVFAHVHHDPGGRCLVPVVGKWAISFVMTASSGPDDLRLEKTGKTWSESPNLSSHPKGPATS
ncbi:MAG: hypothetical protein WDN01_02795 [Rhizomicrobium sp.]